MRISKVSFRNIFHKPLSSILSIILLAFGVGIIIMMMGTTEQLEKQFTKNIKGIDMVVGAKGSPLQLILSSVYQIDAPTGNISLDEFNKLSKNPLVEKAIPLAYGDNYEGYRIVGTSEDYPAHYSAKLSNGNWWAKTGEVVVGARVAQLTGISIGDEFSGSHGLSNSIEEHDHFAYKVVGIMEPTGTVVDKLLLTDISSVWAVHDHHEEGHADHDHEHEEPKEITAGIVSFKSPMGNLTIPRMVNQNTNMQAALPAIEVNRLFSLMGSGVKTLRILAVLIIVLSAFSVFVSLWQSLKERRYELALLRSMGGSGRQLLWIVLAEGLILSFAGYILGLILGKTSLLFISKLTEQTYQYEVSQQWISSVEIALLPIALGIGTIAAAIPAIQAYRTNISKVLSDA